MSGKDSGCGWIWPGCAKAPDKSGKHRCNKGIGHARQKGPDSIHVCQYCQSIR